MLNVCQDGNNAFAMKMQLVEKAKTTALPKNKCIYDHVFVPKQKVNIDLVSFSDISSSKMIKREYEISHYTSVPGWKDFNKWVDKYSVVRLELVG